MGSSKFFRFFVRVTTWSDALLQLPALWSIWGPLWCVGGNHTQKCPEKRYSASTHLLDASNTQQPSNYSCGTRAKDEQRSGKQQSSQAGAAPACHVDQPQADRFLSVQHEPQII